MLFEIIAWAIDWSKNTIVCLDILCTKNMYYVETDQLICIVSQLTGFYIIQIFSAKNLQLGYNYKESHLP